MIELPKTKDPDTKDLCKCRPICKDRRRYYEGKILNTSAELLIERKPVYECVHRWPKKALPNKPCPLFAKTKQVNIQPRYQVCNPPTVVRICGAPIDDVVPTPYLRAAEFLQKTGVAAMVKTCCPFCKCGASKCCSCGTREYPMRDPERKTYRRADMHEFDARVKDTYDKYRPNMYNDPFHK